MVIKVCGIKSDANIDMINQTSIDMVGLNFYAPSVRYVGEDRISSFRLLSDKISRVGVFVNETLDNINRLATLYQLDYIQLHGDEDMDYCREVAQSHKIIKVFRVDESFDFGLIELYAFAEYYLFDTATIHFGGSGKKFDWSILNQYTGSVPFLLSGGIGPDDYDALQSIQHPMYKGIDINSKFENEPGIKDPELLHPFLNKLRSK